LVYIVLACFLFFQSTQLLPTNFLDGMCSGNN
jgi:hypothetical protein